MRSANDVMTIVVLACCVGGCATEEDVTECSAQRPDSCGEEAPVCLVEENRCVECVVAEDCPYEGMRCLDWACLPEAAPDFTLVDLNPQSPSYEQSITLSDHFGSVILVYFAALG